MRQHPRPTPKLRKFVEVYGGVYAAATAWEIPYNTLDRFLNGTTGISLGMAMQISDTLGVPLDELFEQPQTTEKA